MFMSLFATAEPTQKATPALDLGSIISSMPSLPVQKTLNRSNTSDLLDVSKELSEHEKFLAKVCEIKQKKLAEKEANKKKSKGKQEKKSKGEKKEKKENGEGDWFLKTSKTKLLNQTKYVHPSHLPQGLRKDEEVSDDVSEISYIDEKFDDIQIKKKSMEEGSDKGDDCSPKQKKQPEKAKIINTLTVNQGTSSKSTTPSRSPSPMPRDLSKELNIKNNKTVSEKANPRQHKETKDDKKSSSYLQKLYQHREATEKVQTSGQKVSVAKEGMKKEVTSPKITKSSDSSHLTSSSKTVVSSSSGKRPLENPSSKDEPNRVKKAIIENKNGTSLKSRQVEHDRVKHSKQKKVTYVSEDEDEDDSFIDDEEFEQRDCEEMELYRKFMAAYRRKTAIRRHLEKDIRDMEATFEELQKEDKRTALIGKMEDEVELVAINKEREREMKHQKSKSRKI